MIKTIFNFRTIIIFLLGVLCGGLISITPSIYISESESTSLQDSVIREIKNLNLKHPHIVLAQAQIESNNFKSRLFRLNNNMFGMKVAKSRPTCARKSSNGYAVYDNWKESLVDYALYQSSFLRNKKEEDYLKSLSLSYASDPDYIAKIADKSKLNKKFFKI